MAGGRRRLCAKALVAAAAVWLQGARPALADDVPIELQVDLLARVVKFERTFGIDPKAPATVLIVSKSGVVVSTRAGAQSATALKRAGTLAGRVVNVVTHTFTQATDLKNAARGSAIVYVMPGLSDEFKAIANVLRGMHVLLVAARSEDVDRGAALAFELQSARPRIVVNLPQARAQNLDFNSQLLRLAKVIQ